jgi:lipopolysaccharide/colanic/teichoic acid biosynthesis glycosyltransferase
VTFHGPAWVGAGRKLSRTDVVVGPAVLWDDPAARPKLTDIAWQELEPVEAPFMGAPPRAARAGRPGKRVFDVLFSLFALAVTLPFWPLIILAIILEDGWPPFFVHRRETLGGCFFPCIKFRSLRRGASREAVAAVNLADGPQVYVKDDPRATRVGRLLRATKLDELPQFLNVLAGHMSVIGPRPSPFDENQFCPGWREARLSVRPGITGLWQVCRTRAQGEDFQEWIRYDLEYVARNHWRLDLWIFWRTFIVLLGGRK